jgi:exo-beta-1,3-glucanase (GH17 family)
MIKRAVVFFVVILMVFGCGGGSDNPTDSTVPSNPNNPTNPTDPAYQLHGVNFSPFVKNGQDPNAGASVSRSQVEELMETASPYFEWARAFGSTNGAEFICPAAQANGNKCYGSAWLGKDLAANERELNALISLAQAGYVDVAVIGSETILRADLSEEQLLGYMDRFALAVPEIPLTTADVYYVLLDHPAIMEACDFIFVNYYPYWEGVSVEYAVATIDSIHKKMKAAAQGKEVIVSETGWPSCGDTIADAEPSPENASFFFMNVVSWAREENVKVVYFEAFDEPWKAKYEGPQGACWGIFDGNLFLKPGFQDVFDGQTMENNWSGLVEPGGPGTPEIELTYVPARGSSENLRGQVWHVMPDEYRVVVYIYVVGSWWVKPTWAQPTTRINPDGTFMTDITTGGSDANASSIAAYLIPADYAPPTTYNQAVLEANAVAFVKVNR